MRISKNQTMSKRRIYKGIDDNDDVIIKTVNALPSLPEHFIYYFFCGSYYYWDFESKSYMNVGKFRPTKPPDNP